MSLPVVEPGWPPPQAPPQFGGKHETASLARSLAAAAKAPSPIRSRCLARQAEAPAFVAGPGAMGRSPGARIIQDSDKLGRHGPTSTPPPSIKTGV